MSVFMFYVLCMYVCMYGIRNGAFSGCRPTQLNHRRYLRRLLRELQLAHSGQPGFCTLPETMKWTSSDRLLWPIRSGWFSAQKKQSRPFSSSPLWGEKILDRPMNEWMNVCMYVCTYVCMYVCSCYSTPMNSPMPTRPKYMYVRVYECRYLWRMCVSMHVCMYGVFIDIRIYVCLNLCI